jgi:GNAT superfamily N-acetyltransferase
MRVCFVQAEPKGQQMALRIDYLIDRPKFVPLVARWKYRQWRFLYARTLRECLLPWRTPAAWVRGVRANLGKGAISTTWIAFDDGKAAGVASLVDHDHSSDDRENASRCHLTPWLSGLYVAAPCRKRGIASALVDRVVEEARALNVPKLYLQTFDLADYYRRRGWEQVGRAAFEGRGVVIMAKETA